MLIYLSILSLVYKLNFCFCTEHGTGSDPNGNNLLPISGTPKDYTFSSDTSRVKNLVNFFEEFKHDDNYNSNPKTRRKQNLLISLPEAAGKLHLLSDGLPLDIKCNKYVRLIEQPDIRTFYKVNQLVDEKRLPVEVAQNDANLVEKLSNERKFDPLGKIQAILQSLDSEKENLRSSYSQSIQKDLYDCISYYIYRYQRATTDLVEHVRERQTNLCQFEQENELDINLRKLNEAVKNIESIESSQEVDVVAWLRELSNLHDLIGENNFEIPIKIQKFIIQPDRLQRLESFNKILNLAGELKQKASSLEESERALNQKDQEEYQRTLLELNKLQDSYKDFLPVDIYNYIHQSDRWKLIDGFLTAEETKREGDENGNKLDDQKQEMTASLNNHAIEVLKEENPISLDKKTINEAAKIEIAAQEMEKDELSASNLSSKSPIAEMIKVTPQTSKEYNNPEVISAPNLSNQEALEEQCSDEVAELLNNLRLFNWQLTNHEEAKSLSLNLNRFMDNCYGVRDSIVMTNLNRRARWPIISLTRKLSSWCLETLKNSSPSVELGKNKQCLASVLEVLNKIKAKDLRIGGEPS